ncbi:hypothetical protein RHMOL_Rhmol13G0301200 [Rhododendron molle]|uniref:Uncharacterized protein n=1 Tax=Rhododendron molle TaxID=49168 RepID=A0ACC0LCQ6_RHOML|nr:hypothetical protein RHMOL_Rhmol13G0301200 [Rhododendron molle]
MCIQLKEAPLNDSADERRGIESRKKSCYKLILINTFRELEAKYNDYLAILTEKKTIPVGPLVHEIIDGDKDLEIFQWLDEKDELSTVFVSFGSETYLSKEEREEIAHGLLISGIKAPRMLQSMFSAVGDLYLYKLSHVPLVAMLRNGQQFHLFQRRLNEGASQIPESSESPALREELFTNVPNPDRNGRGRTYGLGPCPSQVFGTRYTRSQEQRVKDQLRAELRAELGAELRAELRQEVLRDVNDEITQLKNQYATVAVYMKSAGHPLPASPNGAGNGDGDHTPSPMEHNGQVDRT